MSAKLGVLLPAIALTACSGIQSALAPQGPTAHVIAQISWVLFIGSALIFLLVTALAGYALLGRFDRRAWIAQRGTIIGAGIVFPVIVLSALLIYTFAAAAKIVGGAEPTPLKIEVIGEQWWWRVRYLNPAGEPIAIAANEIHIPVGRPVELSLKSADVIHSFWVPNLAGKLDMIPGHVNVLRLRASEAGVFRGQCAEYCGGPHAKMALFVVAEPPEEFERWLAHQSRPAEDPATPFLARGKELFLAHACAVCHAIRGADAKTAPDHADRQGRAAPIGPDLTHVGSRLTIGAGILPNTVGTLAGWIADSQQIKPGNRMPSFGTFTGEELRALAAYLESLK